MPNTVCVRSLVPKLKNVAVSAICPAIRAARGNSIIVPDLIREFDAGLVHDLGRNTVDQFLEYVEFAFYRDQRHHHLGLDRLPGFLHHGGTLASKIATACIS